MTWSLSPSSRSKSSGGSLSPLTRFSRSQTNKEALGRRKVTVDLARRKCSPHWISLSKCGANSGICLAANRFRLKVQSSGSASPTRKVKKWMKMEESRRHKLSNSCQKTWQDKAWTQMNRLNACRFWHINIYFQYFCKNFIILRWSLALRHFSI